MTAEQTATAFIDMCGMFLVPASILFAAIGIALKEPLKALISLMGTGLSALWFYRIWVWTDLQWPDWVTGVSLAGVFFLASAASTIVHTIRVRAEMTSSASGGLGPT